MSDGRLGAGIPRRNCVDLMTPTERAIREVVHQVEGLGAHALLTDAVVLLGEAREKLADWVDAGKPGGKCGRSVPTGDYPEYSPCVLEPGHEGRCSLVTGVSR